MLSQEREGNGAPSERSNPEFPNVRVVTGLHPSWPAVKLIGEPLRKGCSQWNKSVKNRLGKRPSEIITIDGVTPLLEGWNYSDFYFWHSLPGWPSEISGTEKGVLLVTGDIGWGSGEAIFGKKIMEMGVKEGVENQTDIFLRNSLTRSLLKAVPFLFLSFKVTEQGSRVFSRREMLKIMLSVPAFYLSDLSPLLISKLSAVQSSNEISDFLIDTSGKFRCELFQDPFISGRSALLIAKTQDTISRLGKPRSTPAAVLLGADHAPDSYKFLSDPKAREAAICSLARQYVSSFSQIFGGVFDRFEKRELKEWFGFSDEGELRNTVLDFMARTQVFKILDPKKSASSPNGCETPSEEVDWFLSSQVLEAVRGLRQ